MFPGFQLQFREPLHDSQQVYQFRPKTRKKNNKKQLELFVCSVGGIEHCTFIKLFLLTKDRRRKSPKHTKNVHFFMFPYLYYVIQISSPLTVYISSLSLSLFPRFYDVIFLVLYPIMIQLYSADNLLALNVCSINSCSFLTSVFLWFQRFFFQFQLNFCCFFSFMFFPLFFYLVPKLIFSTSAAF